VEKFLNWPTSVAMYFYCYFLCGFWQLQESSLDDIPARKASALAPDYSIGRYENKFMMEKIKK